MLRVCVLISVIVVGVAGQSSAADMSSWRTAQAQDCQCSWVQHSSPGQAAQNQTGCMSQSQCQQVKGVCGGPCKGP
jgi:hypothetical protein